MLSSEDRLNILAQPEGPHSQPRPTGVVDFLRSLFKKGFSGHPHGVSATLAPHLPRSGKILLNEREFSSFIKASQHETFEPKDLQLLMANFMPPEEQIEGGQHVLDADGFVAYILDTVVNTAANPAHTGLIYHDMSLPLTSYYLRTASWSAHLHGSISPAAWIGTLLMSGVRVVPIMLLDSEQGSVDGQPLVAHSPASEHLSALPDVITAITAKAFATSVFPVILMVDYQYASSTSQSAAAEAMRNGFGSTLLTSAGVAVLLEGSGATQLNVLCLAPFTLQRRILIMLNTNVSATPTAALTNIATLTGVHCRDVDVAPSVTEPNEVLMFDSEVLQPLLQLPAQKDSPLSHLAKLTLSRLLCVTSAWDPSALPWQAQLSHAAGHAADFDAMPSMFGGAQIVQVDCPGVVDLRGVATFDLSPDDYENSQLVEPTLNQRIVAARFRDNGGCGWLIKPLELQRGGNSYRITHRLQVGVIALVVPKSSPASVMARLRDRSIFLMVGLSSPSAEGVEWGRTTSKPVMYNDVEHWYMPCIWNDEILLDIAGHNISTVVFRLVDSRSVAHSEDHLGEAIIPLHSLREGFRMTMFTPPPHSPLFPYPLHTLCHYRLVAQPNLPVDEELALRRGVSHFYPFARPKTAASLSYLLSVSPEAAALRLLVHHRQREVDSGEVSNLMDSQPRGPYITAGKDSRIDNWLDQSAPARTDRRLPGNASSDSSKHRRHSDAHHHRRHHHHHHHHQKSPVGVGDPPRRSHQQSSHHRHRSPSQHRSGRHADPRSAQPRSARLVSGPELIDQVPVLSPGFQIPTKPADLLPNQSHRVRRCIACHSASITIVGQKVICDQCNIASSDLTQLDDTLGVPAHGLGEFSDTSSVDHLAELEEASVVSDFETDPRALIVRHRKNAARTKHFRKLVQEATSRGEPPETIRMLRAAGKNAKAARYPELAPFIPDHLLPHPSWVSRRSDRALVESNLAEMEETIHRVAKSKRRIGISALRSASTLEKRIIQMDDAVTKAAIVTDPEERIVALGVPQDAFSNLSHLQNNFEAEARLPKYGITPREENIPPTHNYISVSASPRNVSEVDNFGPSSFRRGDDNFGPSSFRRGDDNFGPSSFRRGDDNFGPSSFRRGDDNFGPSSSRRGLPPTSAEDGGGLW